LADNKDAKHNGNKNKRSGKNRINKNKFTIKKSGLPECYQKQLLSFVQIPFRSAS
jgi:hypothetical protein